MKSGRRIWLVMAVALGSVGCRAAGTGTLSLFPRSPAMQGTFDKDEFVAQHNRNAESIQSLVAKPSIKVARRMHPQFHLDGHMAMERPHNFRLELTAVNKTQADIGSNEEEFWFWFATEPSLYWCKYADLDSSSLAMTYQPDWILEAMGLKTISPLEAEQIQVKRMSDPGTTALIFPATRSGTENYRRWLIVSNRERRIKQLRIYSAKDPTVLIAQADPSQYKDFPVTPGESGTTRKTCYLPENLVLEWKRDQAMKLEVEMLEVELNQFDPSLRANLFTEPTIAGYPRKNLADHSRGSRLQGQRTSTRRTLPAPSSRTGIELGRPAPLSDDDDPVVPKLGSSSTAPPSTTPPPDLPSLEALVGSPVPTAPESPAVQSARSNPYPPSGLTIER
jgi:hypothetical protein